MVEMSKMVYKYVVKRVTNFSGSFPQKSIKKIDLRLASFDRTLVSAICLCR